MKKILFMLSSMNIGGVEKSLLSLLSVLSKERYDITLLLLEKKGGFLKAVPNWVKVEEVTWYKEIKPVIMQPPQQTIKNYVKKRKFTKIPTFVCSYFLSKYLNNRYLYYKEVFKSIAKHKDSYDIAISYQGPTDIIDYYIANKVTAQKKISWVHFDVSKHDINKKLYQKLYSRFDKIFIVSKEAKQRLITKIPSTESKTEVFMSIISKVLINKMAKEEVDFDDNYKGLRVVTVGRLSKEKGQELAIEVLARLRKEGHEIRWYCIGEGGARKEYEFLIDQYNLRNDFVLLGAKTNPYPYILKADIYIQTSKHEGYCLTLAEAKCLNKPIITTNFIGAYEQIEHDNNGIIVSYDREELYEKIKYLINDSKKRNYFTNNLKNLNNNTTTNVRKLINIIG